MAFTFVNIHSSDGAETSLHNKGVEHVMLLQLLSRAAECQMLLDELCQMNCGLLQIHLPKEASYLLALKKASILYHILTSSMENKEAEAYHLLKKQLNVLQYCSKGVPYYPQKLWKGNLCHNCSEVVFRPYALTYTFYISGGICYYWIHLQPKVICFLEMCMWTLSIFLPDSSQFVTSDTWNCCIFLLTQ